MPEEERNALIMTTLDSGAELAFLVSSSYDRDVLMHEFEVISSSPEND